MLFINLRNLLLILMICLQTNLWAQANLNNLNSRLVIGAGGAQQQQTISAFVRIRAESRYEHEGFGDESDYIVLVRFSGDMNFVNGESRPSYIDVQADFLGYGYDSGYEDGWRGQLDATIGNLNYHRNLQINEDYHYNISLIGLHGAVTGDLLPDQIQFFAEASFDFVGLAYDVRKAQDQASLSPRSLGLRNSYALAFETGVSLFQNRIRLALGGQIMSTSAQGTRYRNGTFTCSETSNGRTYRCRENISVDYDEYWMTQNYYLDLSFHLLKALRIFGRASTQIFSLNDETNTSASSSQRGWLYQVGVTYTLGSKN